MNILQFIITFIGLCLICSVSIYGWYCITRGYWEITPDGRWQKKGMIFKYWSLFWEQYRATKRVYYIGKPLADKYLLVSKIRPDLIPGKYHIDILEMQGYLKPPLGKCMVDEKDLDTLKDLLLCEIEWDGNKNRFRFYKEEPIYDFPEWLQKPLSSCPPCMSSVYGAPIWLLFLKLQKDAFLWTNYPITAEITFGFIFLLTLACLNSILHKLLKF